MLRATTAGLEAIGEPSAAPAEAQTADAFTQAVIGVLDGEGCRAVITTEPDAQTMIRDGLANGSLTKADGA